MKHLSAIMIIALALLLTGSVNAQSLGDKGVKATIPFAFVVAEKALPAGEYVIMSPTNFVVQFVALDKTNVRILTTVLPGAVPTGQIGKLVFHKYGDRYFLYEAVSPTTNMSVVLPPSRLENRVVEGEASVPTAETVYLALK